MTWEDNDDEEASAVPMDELFAEPDLDEPARAGPVHAGANAEALPPDARRRALTAFLVWLTDGNGLVRMEGAGYRYHVVAGDDDISARLDKYEGLGGRPGCVGHGGAV